MNVALPSRVLSLFSGVGGLDLGLGLASGARTICYVEREAFCAAVLVARMEEEALDKAPIWDDVTTFDGRAWRGVVDCVVGGSPCQDLSVAGKRVGIRGARSGLWKQFRRIADETNAPWVFWENVGGAIGGALDVVAEDLEGLGYRVAACTLTAGDVGATHERLRLFVLAYSRRFGKHGLQSVRLAECSKALEFGATGEALANSNRLGFEGERRGGLLNRKRKTLRGDVDGCSFPPGPDDTAGWAKWRGPQPTIRRGAHGAAGGVDPATRNDRLRALGNGVVPQQAAAAFLVCLQRLMPMIEVNP